MEGCDSLHMFSIFHFFWSIIIFFFCNLFSIYLVLNFPLKLVSYEFFFGLFFPKLFSMLFKICIYFILF
jgi:hypothetical protein